MITPGPWTAEYLNRWSIFGEYEEVARVFTRDEEEAASDARAIAKLPEMIEVLKHAQITFAGAVPFFPALAAALVIPEIDAILQEIE